MTFLPGQRRALQPLVALFEFAVALRKEDEVDRALGDGLVDTESLARRQAIGAPRFQR